MIFKRSSFNVFLFALIFFQVSHIGQAFAQADDWPIGADTEEQATWFKQMDDLLRTFSKQEKISVACADILQRYCRIPAESMDDMQCMVAIFLAGNCQRDFLQLMGQPIDKLDRSQCATHTHLRSLKGCNFDIDQMCGKAALTGCDPCCKNGVCMCKPDEYKKPVDH